MVGLMKEAYGYEAEGMEKEITRGFVDCHKESPPISFLLSKKWETVYSATFIIR